MDSVQKLLQQLRERREELLRIHDLSKPLSLIVSQESGGDALVPEFHSIPMPSNAGWWVGNPEWEYEAQKRMAIGGFISVQKPNGSDHSLYWHWSICDSREFLPPLSLVFESLSRIASAPELGSMTEYFSRAPRSQFTPWLFLVCELAWKDPLALSGWSHVTPIESFGAYGPKAHEEHRRRIGLDTVSSVFGLPEKPFVGVSLYDCNSPPGSVAWKVSHWWIEFYDIVRASIEAIDWIDEFLRKTPPAAQASSAIESGADNDDGPRPPKAFHWHGKTAKLSPQSWKVVNYVWGQPKKRCHKDDVAVGAWDDEEKGGKALTEAMSKANTALSELAIPVSIHRDGDFIEIHVDGKAEK